MEIGRRVPVPFLHVLRGISRCPIRAALGNPAGSQKEGRATRGPNHGAQTGKETLPASFTQCCPPSSFPGCAPLGVAPCGFPGQVPSGRGAKARAVEGTPVAPQPEAHRTSLGAPGDPRCPARRPPAGGPSTSGADLPALVMIISVPASWNFFQSSFSCRPTLMFSMVWEGGREGLGSAGPRSLGERTGRGPRKPCPPGPPGASFHGIVPCR